MSFFFFKRKQDRGKLAVVVDVGNRSVGAGLVRFSKIERPEILYISRRNIRLLKKPKAADLLFELKKALTDVLFDIFKEGFPHARFTYFKDIIPDLTFFTLASPWHISQIRTARKKETQPFLVEAKLLADIVQHEFSEFLKMHKPTEITGNVRHSHELIEGDILEAELNTYKTTDPLGKMAQDLSITLFTSSAPTDFVRALKDISDKTFPHSEQRFASFIFSFFTTVRDIWHTTPHFILCDVSGEITDIAVIRDGKLLEVRSIPIGTNTAVRFLCERLHMTAAESGSTLQRFFNRRLVSAQENKVRTVLQGLEKRWVADIASQLETIAVGSPLPSTVFLTADSPYAEWFARVVKSESMRSAANVAKHFSPVVLTGETLSSYCSFYPGVPKDSFIAIAALFLNRKIGVV